MNENLEIIIRKDAKGRPLEGGRSYQLRMPSPIPACNFWSVVVYVKKTGLIIHAGQLWPSVHSSCKNLVFNQDGSVDIWFGPLAPDGKGRNWIQTTAGQEWFMILRLYETTGPQSEKSWKPGEIKEVVT